MSVKNIIDVLDEEESIIEYDEDEDEMIIASVVISKIKLEKIPKNKRLVFRVKGIDNIIFFDGDLIEVADKYFSQHGAQGIMINEFTTSEDAPRF